MSLLAFSLLPALGATIVVVGIGTWAFLWYTRKIWFYRDPDHTQTPQVEDAILSPVYGIVAYIKPIRGGVVVSEKLGEAISIADITHEAWPVDLPAGDGWLVGIAMTALDVHYQYSPIPGVLQSSHHFQHGRNLPMFDLWEYVRITWLRQFVQLWAKRYVFENERQTMWLENSRVKLALVLIADKFVDKITSYVEPGLSVRSGEKLSFISRGSQVDVVICGHPNLEILVQPGEAMRGPLTQIARLHPMS